MAWRSRHSLKSRISWSAEASSSRTKKPRRGWETNKPRLSSSRAASRIGARLTPRSRDNATSESRSPGKKRPAMMASDRWLTTCSTKFGERIARKVSLCILLMRRAPLVSEYTPLWSRLCSCRPSTADSRQLSTPLLRSKRSLLTLTTIAINRGCTTMNIPLAIATAAALGATTFSSAMLADEPRHGGTINTIIQPEPPGLVLGMVQNAPTRTVAGNIYEGLLRYDSNLEPIPQLAESWETSDDDIGRAHDRTPVTWPTHMQSAD